MFIKQYQDSTCMAIAIINACRHLNVEPPLYNKLIRDLHCNNGKSFGEQNIIKKIFGEKFIPLIPDSHNYVLPMFEKFMKTGGIFSIMHPIFNLHSSFCYPNKNGYTWVNSWMGPNILVGIGIQEIEKLLPSFPNAKFWAIRV